MTDDRAQDPALKLLLDALDRTPDNLPLRLHIAGALEKASRLRDALEHFQACIDDPSLGDEARLGVSRCRLGSGDAERAIEVLEPLLERSPNHARALIARARARNERQQGKEALADYDRAVSSDPTVADSALRDVLVRNATDARSRFRVVDGGGSRPDESADSEPSIDADRGAVERITFADVGGLDETKERIRMRIVYPFVNPEMFKTFGKKVGGGLLLFGPPGCGKTFLARATAGECRAHFVSVGLHEVLDMWLGNSERQLHALFDDARRRAPSVLFFDEVDALGIQRAKLQSASMRGVITQFLTEMDGMAGRNDRLLVIGATNTPWDLDPAFRRPGRFDQVLFVPPPDRAARRRILELKMGQRPHAGVDFERIATQTEGWSGADLEHLIEVAAEFAITQSIARGAIEPISAAHIDKARGRVKPTTREWFTTARNYAQYANEAGQYDDIADYMKKHNL